MRATFFAGFVAGALTIVFNSVAHADPGIAIKDATREDIRNSKEIKKSSKRDPATEEGAKQIAKGIAKKAKDGKPNHPIVIFFKVLLKSKPAY